MDNLSELTAGMPKSGLKRFEELVGATDAFCGAHLNAEYKELCREMAAALCRKRKCPVHDGKSVGWAAGIVYALGQINFLMDRSQNPHMKSAEIAEGFGISQATMLAKAKVIREKLGLIQMDPRWCLTSMLDDNPLVWMLEVNGFIRDIRTAPREAQVVAYENGLIPYIPADRRQPSSDKGDE